MKECRTVRELQWNNLNIPVGVEYNQTHYIPQVPKGMGSDTADYYTPYEWTNVRGYGNILQYQKLPQPFMVGYKVYPWNR